MPIFLNTDSTKKILEEVISIIPESTTVYLFGGAIRNAIYFDYFGEEMTQRDYDCLLVGDGEVFAENLLRAGFIYGNKNTEKAKVLKKARVENPTVDFADWLYFDCKIYPIGTSIEYVLNDITDFSINGVALSLKDIERENWKQKIIAIPNAIDDIKEKQLRVINLYTPSIYKIIRSVSQGFQKPTSADILHCLEKLKNITQEKFKFNVEKTIKYIGSEEKVREIMNQLGVTKDILNFEEIKNL